MPVLDLYQVNDPAERLARTTAYVKALEAYVPALEESHGSCTGPAETPRCASTTILGTAS